MSNLTQIREMFLWIVFEEQLSRLRINHRHGNNKEVDGLVTLADTDASGWGCSARHLGLSQSLSQSLKNEGVSRVGSHAAHAIA